MSFCQPILVFVESTNWTFAIIIIRRTDSKCEDEDGIKKCSSHPHFLCDGSFATTTIRLIVATHSINTV